MSPSKRIITTYALPYANGPLHLGHMMGLVQTDIFSRFHKLNGHECYFVCGSDAHGTPIMLKARERGQSPEEFVYEMSRNHQQDCSDFLINFDSFHSTHRPDNEQLVQSIYHKLQANGDIKTKTIKQAYDDQAKMFLPDRFIQGTCPKCQAPEQHGDSCEVCGSTYEPTEMTDAVSVLTGSKPIYKESEHYFFQLGHYQDMLANWIAQDHLQAPIAQKIKEWFANGLKDWDISRDAPYFGFEIPGARDKFFYVWLDAPIGYLAGFNSLCSELGLNFDEFWSQAAETELYQFIGKDIAYFHALFWPAVLQGAGMRLPTAIQVHGFLTVNGDKMSKSRGTSIKAADYLQHFDAEYLRYYFATKLNDNIGDIDLNLTDFVQRVNSDLVGKFVNIASRCSGFLKKKFNGQLSDELQEPELFDYFAQQGQSIANCYHKRNFAQAMREIMQLADRANQFIEQYKPWELARQEDQLATVHKVCSQAINHFYQLMIYLKPVLPKTATACEDFLAIEPATWHDSKKPLLDHTIKPFKPLMQRLDQEQVTRLVQQA